MADGRISGTDSNQTPNAIYGFLAVRVWGISSMLKRETAQTVN